MEKTQQQVWQEELDMYESIRNEIQQQFDDVMDRLDDKTFYAEPVDMSKRIALCESLRDAVEAITGAESECRAEINASDTYQTMLVDGRWVVEKRPNDDSETEELSQRLERDARIIAADEDAMKAMGDEYYDTTDTDDDIAAYKAGDDDEQIKAWQAKLDTLNKKIEDAEERERGDLEAERNMLIDEITESGDLRVVEVDWNNMRITNNNND